MSSDDDNSWLILIAVFFGAIFLVPGILVEITDGAWRFVCWWQGGFGEWPGQMPEGAIAAVCAVYYGSLLVWLLFRAKK